MLSNIDLKFWEGLARDRDGWRATVKCCVKRIKEQWTQQRAEKRQKRKARLEQPRQTSAFVCPYCNRDCQARIGLISHTRSCQKKCP